MNSLKRLVWLAFIVVSLLLGFIILLGGYQYRLTGDYSRILSQNESALFHFMTIRETITETLIAGNWDRLDGVTDDIEKLNSELSKLKSNKLVAAELKLALVDKVDLKELAILLHQVINEPDKIEGSRQLQQQLRSISDFLLQYDRIIVGQARERIVHFQTVVIGALGLIISLASFSLILLYRNTVAPLLNLSAQLQGDGFDGEELTVGQPVVKEVADLVSSISRLAQEAHRDSEPGQAERAVEDLLAEKINETTNRLNGIINYAQLLSDSSDQPHSAEENREMLQKIIDSGVHIAGEWQKIK